MDSAGGLLRDGRGREALRPIGLGWGSIGWASRVCGSKKGASTGGYAGFPKYSAPRAPRVEREDVPDFNILVLAERLEDVLPGDAHRAQT